LLFYFLKNIKYNDDRIIDGIYITEGMTDEVSPLDNSSELEKNYSIATNNTTRKLINTNGNIDEIFSLINYSEFYQQKYSLGI
jgi:hypothetical protein